MKKEKGIAKRYFGGKGSSGAVQKIINCIRPHDTLIEGCLGNAQLSRTIKKPGRIIGNDISQKVYNKWKEINHPWLELHNLPVIDLLQKLDFSKLGKTVIYLDPPYPLKSRKNPQLIYDHEMLDLEHVELLEFIKDLPIDVDVLISTYPNTLYKEHLKNWQRLEFRVKTSHGMATEHLYYNYDDLSLLHDYRFAGNCYRERLQIKRKAQRWVNRLQQMPDYERQVILEEILKLPEFSTVAEKVLQ